METSFTHARNHLAQLCDAVVDDGETVIIHRSGSDDVALISAAELRSMVETLHIFGTAANARRFIDAYESSRRGEGTVMTMEELRRYVGVDATVGAG